MRIVFIVFLLTFGSIASLFNSSTFRIGEKNIIRSSKRYDLMNLTRKISKTSKANSPQAIIFVTPDCSYKALEYLVSIANQSIHIMIYEMWSVNVANLLANASMRGVDIKIVFEGKTYSTSGIEYNRNMSAMLYNFSNGLIGPDNIHFENVSVGYFHPKVIIVDSKVALITSENIFPTSFPKDPTNIDLKPYSTTSRGWGIILFDDIVAQELDSIFWEVFNNYSSPYVLGDYGQEPPDRGVLRYSPTFDWQVINDLSNVALVTTLGYKNASNSYEKISGLISSSEEYVFMEQMYIYNDTEIIQKLIQNLTAVHSRGVTIQIILEDSFQSNYENISKYLESLGMHVAPAFNVSYGYLFLHNKGMIVDDDKVLIGSINWSGSAMQRNTEVGVIITSKQANKYYTDVFGFDWKNSEGVTFDTDYDGLSDIYEYEHSLNAGLFDTDGDYLSDYDEIFIYNTDPTTSDAIIARIITPTNGEYLSRTVIRLNWSITNMQHVEDIGIYVNNSLYQVVTNTSILLNLTDESYNIIRVSPRAKIPVKIVEARIGVYIDTRPPRIELLSLYNTTNESTIHLLAKMTDFSLSLIEVMLNGTVILKKTISQGVAMASINVTITLHPGVNEIKLIAIDRSGNTQTKVVYITYLESQSNLPSEDNATSQHNNAHLQNERHVLLFHRVIGTLVIIILIISAILLTKKSDYSNYE